ncbi:MAG: small multi-drug export protein [Spirochaetaceae bacterium]|jgi:uncharacterized membrane protein|nr:small multi-drug export protein [Spirochaetaceae bacterium]
MIYLWTGFFSLLPISELRGGIPFALLNGIPWFIAWPFAVAVNSLAAPLCWIFLSTLHRLFYGSAEDGGPKKGFAWYRSIFDRFVERTRAKLRRGVEKWGALGIALFVAIPLPVTGAWTGTLGAWVLGLPKRKTLPAVILGVAAAGAIVTAVVLLGRGAFGIFIKDL